MKRRRRTSEEIIAIHEAYRDLNSCRLVAKKFGMSSSAIHSIIKAYDGYTGKRLVKPGLAGRPKKTTDMEDNIIAAYVKNNPSATRRQVVRDLKELGLIKDISLNTLDRILSVRKKTETRSAHRDFMLAAVEEAEKSKEENGIPIGSVLVCDGQIVGRGRNQRTQKRSVILHAVMDALENAGRPDNFTDVNSFYEKCILYTTRSPCAMCTGAILFHKIPHVVIGNDGTGSDEVQLLRSRGVRVDCSILENHRCDELMKEFTEANSSLWDAICRSIPETESALATSSLSSLPPSVRAVTEE